MAKRKVEAIKAAWESAVYAAGESQGSSEGKVASAVSAIVEAAIEANAENMEKVAGQYVLGYTSVQTAEVAGWIKLDKKAFKLLPGDAKDPGTEKGKAQHARNNASKARNKFMDRVKAGLGISPGGENNGAEGEMTPEEAEADKVKRIDEARKAYAKAVERAEAQIKKARQTLADLEASVIEEARITAGFLCLRGPMGGEPDTVE